MFVIETVSMVVNYFILFLFFKIGSDWAIDWAFEQATEVAGRGGFGPRKKKLFIKRARFG